MYCYVRDCPNSVKNLKKKESELIKYFPSPEDKILLEKWKRVIPKGDKVFSQNDKLCDLHFLSSEVLWFTETKLPNGNVRRLLRDEPILRAGTVPSIFPAEKMETASPMLKVTPVHVKQESSKSIIKVPSTPAKEKFITPKGVLKNVSTPKTQFVPKKGETPRSNLRVRLRETPVSVEKRNPQRVKRRSTILDDYVTDEELIKVHRQDRDEDKPSKKRKTETLEMQPVIRLVPLECLMDKRTAKNKVPIKQVARSTEEIDFELKKVIEIPLLTKLKPKKSVTFKSKDSVEKGAKNTVSRAKARLIAKETSSPQSLSLANEAGGDDIPEVKTETPDIEEELARMEMDEVPEDVKTSDINITCVQGLDDSVVVKSEEEDEDPYNTSYSTVEMQNSISSLNHVGDVTIKCEVEEFRGRTSLDGIDVADSPPAPVSVDGNMLAGTSTSLEEESSDIRVTAVTSIAERSEVLKDTVVGSDVTDEIAMAADVSEENKDAQEPDKQQTPEVTDEIDKLEEMAHEGTSPSALESQRVDDESQSQNNNGEAREAASQLNESKEAEVTRVLENVQDGEKANTDVSDKPQGESQEEKTVEETSKDLEKRQDGEKANTDMSYKLQTESQEENTVEETMSNDFEKVQDGEKANADVSDKLQSESQEEEAMEETTSKVETTLHQLDTSDEPDANSQTVTAETSEKSSSSKETDNSETVVSSDRVVSKSDDKISDSAVSKSDDKISNSVVPESGDKISDSAVPESGDEISGSSVPEDDRVGIATSEAEQADDASKETDGKDATEQFETDDTVGGSTKQSSIFVEEQPKGDGEAMETEVSEEPDGAPTEGVDNDDDDVHMDDDAPENDERIALTNEVEGNKETKSVSKATTPPKETKDAEEDIDIEAEVARLVSEVGEGSDETISDSNQEDIKVVDNAEDEENEPPKTILDPVTKENMQNNEIVLLGASDVGEVAAVGVNIFTPEALQQILKQIQLPLTKPVTFRVVNKVENTPSGKAAQGRGSRTTKKKGVSKQVLKAGGSKDIFNNSIEQFQHLTKTRTVFDFPTFISDINDDIQYWKLCQVIRESFHELIDARNTKTSIGKMTLSFAINRTKPSVQQAVECVTVDSEVEASYEGSKTSC